MRHRRGCLAAQKTEAFFELSSKRAGHRDGRPALRDGWLVRRVKVDFVPGDVGEDLIGLTFLVEGLLEDFRGAGFSEALGEGAGGAVAGHLIMLDALSGADEARVADRGVAVGIDEFLAFLDEALHGAAGLAGRSFVELTEDFLEAIDVDLRLAQVGVERRLELDAGGGLGHFWEGLDELCLGVVEVAQFLDVEVAE